MEGTPFGRYQLIELLGRGGMGEVWRAHDTEIDRVVALKMLLPQLTQDPEFEQRFRREARAAARLDDPNIVPVFDVGEIDGRLYVTMRLIDGVDLQHLLDNGPLEPARAAHIIGQIASALHSAHAAGLVHRDVKPSNILLAHNDFAYLIDFGIARATTDTALTAADSTVGTMAYMAPERFQTGDSGPASDTYALTCVLYQCLTGQLPFPGTNLEQVAVSHLVMPPPRPSTELATVPQAMDDVIATGLAKQPEDRYSDIRDLAVAARQALTPPDTVSRPPPPAAPPKPPRRPNRLVIGVIAAVMLLIAGGTVAALTLDGHDHPAAAPNTGPFTGLYRADFGPTAEPGAGPVTATYALRSACRPIGCVATAARLGGDDGFAPSVQFDEVDGKWLAVTLASEQCRDAAAAESWQVFRLAPQPDGSLAGDYTGTAANLCAVQRSVKFTRTGDLGDQAVPDPADLPPRVTSPAEALHGRYRQTQKNAPGDSHQAELSVATDCLRTGERCISYFHDPSTVAVPLVFADDAWTLSIDIQEKCTDTDLIQVTKQAQFPLPQPLQNPITTLTGHGVQTQAAPCAATVEFDETFTRIGD
ncbi:MAG: serine/threonine protein kinase [Mycolicibacterium cosmeticum]|nr:serine/threonine protein kinase [Mycolicibacterium cosmeticum]